MTHRITKLSIREDAEHGLTQEQLDAIQVDAPTQGSSYEGTLDGELVVGSSCFLRDVPGYGWFRTSVVREITDQPNNTKILKTANSFYLLEELNG